MGKSYHIHIEPQALDDLRNIHSYVTRVLKEPDTAANIYKKIKKEIISLREMPERCSKMEEEPWASRDLRKLLIGNYIAFYLVDNDAVHVLRIVYGGMDLTKQLEYE